MTLEDKAALITGASGGLGSAIAHGLARRGVRVAAHGRDPSTVAKLVHSISDEGGTAVPIVGDVTSQADAERMVNESLEQLGGFDLLVNNAGVMSTSSFLEMDETEWSRVLDVNLGGYFRMGQAAARVMVDQGSGSIVNVSSTRQRQAWPGGTAYATSKGGIAMLTNSMALELAPLGVRVNAIAPGTFVTNMNRQYALDQDFKSKRIATIPLGRYGEPDEVVAAVAYLASDEASFVVGTTIFIDGGQTLW
ncbi:SDR family NAD(P)-dependent oxidoreductase [Streptomyces antimycoticus]|uniref:SDR family NAD(P)-dependent oxidoreductase n=1 Tax=Streptomyces antimycoticus TaxID=68175 RepID=UPI001374ECAA|nr:3-oxoacyl-ACP reductase family protein [Streptomyces antimycoticus]